MAAPSFALDPSAAVACGEVPAKVPSVAWGGARFVDEIGFAFGWIAPEPRLAFALESVSLAASGVEAGKIREIGISRHRAEDLLRI
jgi:hypothetical protein